MKTSLINRPTEDRIHTSNQQLTAGISIENLHKFEKQIIFISVSIVKYTSYSVSYGSNLKELWKI